MCEPVATRLQITTDQMTLKGFTYQMFKPLEDSRPCPGYVATQLKGACGPAQRMRSSHQSAAYCWRAIVSTRGTGAALEFMSSITNARLPLVAIASWVYVP